MREDKFYKIGAGVLIFLIILIISFMVSGKKSNKGKLAEIENQSNTTVSSGNVIESTNTTDIDKLEEIPTKQNNSEDVSKTSLNTVNTTNEDTNVLQSTNALESTEEDDSEDENISEESDELVFKYPVEGEIIRDYAKDKLVYSDTLGEWITHPGIDIKAEKTTIVKSAAPGTVKAIKNDPRYGLTVVVEHSNGYVSVYSNLLTAEFVSIGEKLSEGQTIGTVGNVAPFEILDEAHLHFEIIKDGEQIDPVMYLKK